MSQDLTFSRASESDLVEAMEVLDSRVQWLKSSGSQQWNTRDFTEDMKEAISAGSTWLLRAEGAAVGVMNLTTVADPDFWTLTEQAQRALYIGRMATHMKSRGKGYGELLFKLARAYGARNYLPRIRWDVWRGNQRLYEYYEKLGGSHLRTVEAPHRGSGALFEIAYMESPEIPGNVGLIDPLTAIEVRGRKVVPVHLDDETGTGFRSQNFEAHYHEVDGFDMRAARGPLPLTVPGDDAITTSVYFSGGEWHVDNLAGPIPVRWPGLSDLRPGQPYTIRHNTRESGVCEVRLTGPVLEPA